MKREKKEENSKLAALMTLAGSFRSSRAAPPPHHFHYRHLRRVRDEMERHKTPKHTENHPKVHTRARALEKEGTKKEEEEGKSV